MPLVTKTFSQIITFTRASTATYFDSAGVLQSAAIDIPRFDYNPSTLAARGLLIEEARTNLLLQSEDFATTWAVSNSSITTNATTSPAGTTTADKLVENTATSTHFVSQSIASFTSGTMYSISLYVKAAERTQLQIEQGAAAFGGASPKATFNLSTLTVTLSGGGTSHTASITDAGSGWYRIVSSLQATATAAASTAIYLFDGAGNRSYTGNGTSGLFIWGAQLEVGAFPTSYIPTTTTALTRSADSAVISTLTPWYNVATGTLYGEFNGVASGTRTMEDINDGTANESIRLRTVSTDPKFTVTDGGVDQADIDAGTVASNTTYKFAGAYAANDFAACINGGTVQTDTSGTIPTVTQMMLGNSAASNYLNGYLRRVTYYPRRLSNAELQSITA